MIHEKWFTSDTHFFHTNMLKFVDDNKQRIRPFSSLEEMHEIMIERWNSCIKNDDFVYHLGDVTFQYHKPFQELMYRLKGNKRLIVGNHDKLKQEGLLKHFSKVMLWHGFKEHNFTASHMPLLLDKLRDGKFNVHGHTHQNCMQDKHYINVSVEVRDYYPVHLDTIIKEIQDYKEVDVKIYGRGKT
jgi:calcineurin-like phosphoesterase family protein